MTIAASPTSTFFMLPFSELIHQRRSAAEALRYAIGDDWLQGRTCFGGLVSALAAHAMREKAGAGWSTPVNLLALQTSFVAPVGPGDIEVSVSVLRQGKNVCQVLAHVRQHAQVVAVLMGTYGAARASALETRRPVPQALPHSVEALPAAPQRAAGPPSFLQHFDLRWAAGPPPFSGGSGWHSSQFIRLRDPELASLPSELQVVLLADLAPTPVMGQLSQHAPNSSVSWALELRALTAPAADGWWRADNESLLVEDGYVNHAARLWSPDDRLAAFGTQVVAVFA
ncbi:MAG: thioesterase family protein [Rubrivivax sp.]